MSVPPATGLSAPNAASGPKQELLEEDRFAMLPLPPVEFEARRIEARRATSLSLVRFDRNDYSIPTTVTG